MSRGDVASDDPVPPQVRFLTSDSLLAVACCLPVGSKRLGPGLQSCADHSRRACVRYGPLKASHTSRLLIDDVGCPRVR